MKQNPFERYNYIIPDCDLALLPFCKKGYCTLDNMKVIKAVLHLMGMDMSAPFERVELCDDVIHYNPDGSVKWIDKDVPASFRSNINSYIQTGGYAYYGYRRNDYNEFSAGLAARLLSTEDGIRELLEVINGK